jgi:F0F1-type ATP synthase assembly protein I
MGVELVVATCIGGGIGYWADTLWNTAPWLMLVGVLLGNVAGIRNILRLSRQMDRQSGNED